MRILIANDDGIYSPGIAALADASPPRGPCATGEPGSSTRSTPIA